MKRSILALGAVPLVALLAAASAALGQAGDTTIPPPPMYSELRDQGGQPAIAGWPDGPGRDRTIFVCGACHGAGAMPLSRAFEWADAWDVMIGRGMQEHPDAVRDEVLYYLQNYRSSDRTPPPPGTPGPTGASVGG